MRHSFVISLSCRAGKACSLSYECGWCTRIEILQFEWKCQFHSSLCHCPLAACMPCKPVFESVTKQELGPTSAGTVWEEAHFPFLRISLRNENSPGSLLLLFHLPECCKMLGWHRCPSFRICMSIILPRVGEIVTELSTPSRDFPFLPTGLGRRRGRGKAVLGFGHAVNLALCANSH